MATSPSPITPEEYIANLEEPRRSQIQALYDLVREVAPELEPWVVQNKIGFGKFHYKGKSKACEGEWFKFAVGSNKNTIMIGTCAGAEGHGQTLAESYADQFPKAQIGRSCINFKKFEDIDMKALREIAKKTAAADFTHWVL